jgi:hypothetical protein
VSEPIRIFGPDCIVGRVKPDHRTTLFICNLIKASTPSCSIPSSATSSANTLGITTTPSPVMTCKSQSMGVCAVSDASRSPLLDPLRRNITTCRAIRNSPGVDGHALRIPLIRQNFQGRQIITHGYEPQGHSLADQPLLSSEQAAPGRPHRYFGFRASKAAM